MKGSYFDGDVLGLLGHILLGALLTIITLGIAFPWALCLVERWKLEHTVINNRRLKFTGSGVEAVGLWLLAVELPLVVVGLLTFYLIFGGLFGGLPFRADAAPVMVGLLQLGLWVYTLFVIVWIIKWITRHTIIDDYRSRLSPEDVLPPPIPDGYVDPAGGDQAPLAAFILGILVSVAGLILAIVWHWAGWLISAVGLFLLLAAYQQQK